MRKIYLILLFQLLGLTVVYGTFTHARIDISKKVTRGGISIDNDATYKIIAKPDKTYGYEIFLNGKAFIRQYTIPGQKGLQGFKRKKDAEQVAMLVIKKIRQGIMPPTMSTQELKQLNIIF